MLSKTDKNILRLIDTDPKISQTKISKALGVPQQTVNYRLKKLVKEKQISKFATLIDFMKLGYKEYHIFFRAERYIQREKELMDFFLNHKSIWWAAKIGSFYEIMIQVVVKNHYALEEIIEEINRKFPQMLGDEIMLQVVRHEMFSHSFLNMNSMVKVKYAYQEIDNLMHIDQSDFRILETIKDDCRMPLITISNKLDISVKTIQDRIRKLEENKIIIGYRIFHSIKNKKAYLALIKIGDFSKAALAKLIIDIFSSDEFTQYWRLIGEYNLILHARCESYEEFQRAFTKIREKNSIIKTYRLIPVFNDIIVNTFPCDYEKP